MKRLACLFLGHRQAMSPWRAMSHPTWRWARVIDCARCGKFIRRERTSATEKPLEVTEHTRMWVRDVDLG